MERLGVGHIDVIQCHDVEFVSLEQVAGEAIPALRALQGTGLVRWVGVTGYPLPALLHVARQVPVDTVMSYCHYTVQDRRSRFAASGVPWISGMVAQLPVEQPGKLAAGGQPAPRRRPDRR